MRAGLGKSLGHLAYATLTADLPTGPARLGRRGSHRGRLPRGSPLDLPMPDGFRRSRRFIGHRWGGDQNGCKNSGNFEEPCIHLPL
jgi:hypothetical protein